MNMVADNNFVSNARHIFENLLIGSEYSDVTLACEDDKQIKAHKFILGASSLFFKRIFLENPEPNSLIFLHDIRYSELQTIMKFIYRGEVEVAENILDSFLDTATYLEIKGLGDHIQEFKSKKDKEEISPKETREFERIDSELRTENEFADVLHFTEEEKELFLLEPRTKPEEKETMSNYETIANQSDSKVRNFPCDKCTYRGTTKKVLKEHILTKHEGVKFPCKECPFVSSTTATRYMHNLTKHKGLKFECNICCKEFADPSSLRKHKKYTHEGIRYNCNNCEYSGSTLQLLKLQKTKSHKI